MARLDDGYLLDWAAGSAPDAVRVLAECHLSLKPEARRRGAAVEAAFGACLETLDPAALGARSLERALDGAARISQGAGEAGGREALFPAPLDEIVQRQTGGALVWRKCYGGREEITLDALSGEDVEANLVRMHPGAGVPRHDHDAEELTLVLSGEFHDGRAAYLRGDVCTAGPGVAHRPRAGGDEVCVCLMVSLGGVRPTNPLLAVAQRLFGRRRSWA